MVNITEFQRRVYEIVKDVPRGKIISYKKIANILRTSPRAVGQALKFNPFPEIPCYRVVHSDGRIGGYKGSSVKNIRKKISLLREEGIKIRLTNKKAGKYINAKVI